jgi:hypothetical protein
MSTRSRYADLYDLFDVVEDFTPYGEWATPGEVKDRILAVVQPLTPSLSAKLPGRPYSPERIRAALELLATDPGSQIQRRIGGIRRAA